MGRSRSETACWIDDRLPELMKLRADRFTFDFILCSAVLMSLDSSQIGPAFGGLALLLNPGGKLIVSVRTPNGFGCPRPSPPSF